MLGAILAGAGGVVEGAGSILNAFLQRKTAKENLAYQQQADAMNLTFQKESRDLTMAREDNAVQRRAADMRSAGINPLMAAGSPAQASQVIAPHSEAPQEEMTDFGKDMGAGVMALLKMKQDISMTQAQEDYIKAQTKATMANADMKNYERWSQQKDEEDMKRLGLPRRPHPWLKLGGESLNVIVKNIQKAVAHSRKVRAQKNKSKGKVR